MSSSSFKKESGLDGLSTHRQLLVLGLLGLSAYLAGFSVHAEERKPFIQWHTSNLQYLRGWDYQLGSAKRSIFTFEHANGWKYGDLFLFVDATFEDSSDKTAYGELSPRLSISKITGRSLEYGPLKDVLLATTYERGERGLNRYLYGGALDWKVPGFSFLKTHFYVRDDPHAPSKTWQSTVCWQIPFKLGRTGWVCEGFADFAGSEGRLASNQMIVPRLLLDIGGLVGAGDSKYWLGVEYSYWHNKFGVSGVTESVPQLQVKWQF